MNNYKGKVLILGGGPDQNLLVEEFNNRGFYTIIADYYENPPAKNTAQKHYRISTYDREGVLEIARNEKVDYVTTISTDQPLLVAAYVCEKLGLDFQVSYKQAMDFTNKKQMKLKMRDNRIPTAKFVILNKKEDFPLASHLTYPLIIKPVDSSGSRGVFVVQDEIDLVKFYPEARNHSQTGTVIAEEFILGTEISVDAFVVNSKSYVLSVTENIVQKFSEATSLITQSIYPSRISKEILCKVEEITDTVAKTFGLSDSPLFLQMIVKEDKVFVIEFSARIAGGSKPLFIPIISGVDVVKSYVSIMLNEKLDVKINRSLKTVLVNYIYATPGYFSRFINQDELIKSKTMHRLVPYVVPGAQVQQATNSSNRIGAFFVQDDDLEGAIKKVKIIDKNLKAIDVNGNDLMVHGIFDLKEDKFFIT